MWNGVIVYTGNAAVHAHVPTFGKNERHCAQRHLYGLSNIMNSWDFLCRHPSTYVYFSTWHSMVPLQSFQTKSPSRLIIIATNTRVPPPPPHLGQFCNNLTES